MPKEYRTGASARVQVTYEVDSPGSWGPECTVDQVYDQAAESVVNKVRATFAQQGIVVHDVKVTAIFARKVVS